MFLSLPQTAASSIASADPHNCRNSRVDVAACRMLPTHLLKRIDQWWRNRRDMPPPSRLGMRFDRGDVSKANLDGFHEGLDALILPARTALDGLHDVFAEGAIGFELRFPEHLIGGRLVWKGGVRFGVSADRSEIGR